MRTKEKLCFKLINLIKPAKYQHSITIQIRPIPGVNDKRQLRVLHIRLQNMFYEDVIAWSS